MQTKYSSLAILFHWLTALGIFICFPIGLYMADLKLSPTKLQLISYHKWLGVTIFGILVLRILWRAFKKPPALPAETPKWQNQIAHLTHLALYVLMIAIPLTGWLMSSAKGFTTVYLGIWPLPDFIGKDKELGDLINEAHKLLNYVLLILVTLHIVAVIKHQFFDRDHLMSRMLASWKQKS
jgi:cytochrome b561